MGRITLSFRQSFYKLLNELRRYYQKNLKDKERKRAFDNLIPAASRELGAMSYVRIPYVLDIFKLNSVVDNRKEIERMREEIREIQKEIEDLTQLKVERDSK